MLLAKFHVNWPFCSGEEPKNKFSSCPSILDFLFERFYLFLIYKSSWCFLLSFKSIGLSVQAKNRKIGFQDGSHGGHLGFLIGTILAILPLIFCTHVLFVVRQKSQSIHWIPSEQAASKNLCSKNMCIYIPGCQKSGSIHISIKSYTDCWKKGAYHISRSAEKGSHCARTSILCHI